jgi:hypothetical protein
MKRNCLVPHATAIGCGFAAAILAGFLFTSVPARADIDVRIDISNAPPAPHFVFRARPHEQFIPDRRVYVVDDPRVGDYDCFRYGGYYWVFRDGYWYRSTSWRRRFVVVHPRYVPTVFYQVPPTHWKHHPSGPPGRMNRGGGPPGHMNQGGPPGQMKKGDSGPPGQMKKGDKGSDKHGDRGGK